MPVRLSQKYDKALEELYLEHGWNIERINVQKNMTANAGKEKAPEVLLTNGR